jgi:hypothetical protein
MKEAIEKVKDVGVKEGIDIAVEYTKQFVETLTPIAKQAYEIGLLTLRIDAAQAIVFAVIFLTVELLILGRIKADFARARTLAALPENAADVWRKDATDHLIGDGFPHFVIGLLSIVVACGALLSLANVWLWTKLIAPDLWLAHMAIEKILK